MRKRIVDAYKAGEGSTKLSQRFQVSRSGVRSIIKKFKESRTVQNKSGRGRKPKISKTLERKLVRDVCKETRTTSKTLVNDLAKSGIVVSNKTVTRVLHRNGLRGCRPRKTPLLQKRHLQTRLKSAKDNLEKDSVDWRRVLWSDETKLDSLDIETLLMFGERRERCRTQRPPSPQLNMVVGGSCCGDASVSLELGISSRLKES